MMNPANTVRLLNVYEIKLEMPWECITELDHRKNKLIASLYPHSLVSVIAG